MTVEVLLTPRGPIRVRPMESGSLDPQASSAAELEAQIEAERLGMPFLTYRNASGGQHIYTLEDTATRKISVGRAPDVDVVLGWDAKVSGLHAELERIGADWAVVDDGLSRNGTFVNGERLQGRRRLEDGDTLRFGDTLAIFRDPLGPPRDQTMVAGD
jgi:pSer/pThr/pTyr-binding forkhead associated (FHA) protein